MNSAQTTNSLPNTIAIDGPAGSGKSTLGKNLAAYLGYLYFDTGVMYRAVAWAALHHEISLDDELGITKLANELKIDVNASTKPDGRDNDLLVDGKDVTWKIRQPKVDACVSVVAAYPGVRSALSAQQRRIGTRGKVVMVGRDIGTVVMPDAGLKIYLDASVEERARRRYEERLARNESPDFFVILSSMQKRDEIDSSRAVAPLKPAADAVRLDSDTLDAQQVFEFAVNLVKEFAKS